MIATLGNKCQSAGGGCQGVLRHGPFQALRILANLMNCLKSAFRAPSIMHRTDDSSRSGCLLTYELDFCIHWLEGLPGSQQHANMVLQSLGSDGGLQGLWCVLLQLFPVPTSRY